MECDVVVVGGGVVGLACAAAIARAGRGVLLLERHGTFGQETSSRSSEVVHAGMYYPPGSLKARLCARGNASTWRWCEARGIPHARTGKLIVATCEADEQHLELLRARAAENGVARMEMIGGARVAAREPAVRATAALWSPDTGIVDAHALMASLWSEARAHGADAAFHHALTAAEAEGGGFALRVRDARGETTAFHARAVVNAAGLCSDDIAALPGVGTAPSDTPLAGLPGTAPHDHARNLPRMTWVKGRYFQVRGPAPVRTLIYPVPPASGLGLGVHATVDLAGAVRLGPDVEPMAARIADYTVPPSAAVAFHAAAVAYLPALRVTDLEPAYAGIRPRLPGGDFVVTEESARGLRGWVNLIGIESPGLTCALELGRVVAGALAGAG